MRHLHVESPYSPSGDQPQAIEKLVAGIESGLAKQILLGVTGSGKTFSMARIIEKVQRPAIVLAHNKTLAAQLYGEFKAFFPKNAVEYFVSYYDYYQPEAYVPSSDTFIDKDASVNEHIEQMRLSATKALMERQDVIIVATVSAIYGLGDPEAYLKMVLHLDRGDIIGQRQLLKRLTELQYTRNDTDFYRANFRVRGDTIDIFPAESETDAVRVQLFDEEIEDIALFDPLTGAIKQRIPRITIFPKTHYVTPQDRLIKMVDSVKEELVDRLAVLRDHQRLVEAQRLEQRTLYDIEMIQELGYCSGIENYSRYLSGRSIGEPPPTLFDYIPADALLFIDESHVTVPQLGAMYKGDRSRKETLVEYGFRLPSALDNRPMRFNEFENICPQTIYVSATPGNYEIEHTDAVVEQVVRPTGLVDPIIDVQPASTQVDAVMSEIQQVIARNERILITTLTKRMAEDLTGYLNEHGIRVRYLHSDIDTVERVEIIRDLRLGAFDVLVGINLLREGLDMPEVSLVAILDADKEGFLRSERSLIQTIGRAARNANGRVILFADTITRSMRKAMDETQRRREKQIAYNQQQGIIPKTIRKSVDDILEGAVIPGKKSNQSNSKTKHPTQSKTSQNLTLEESLARGELPNTINPKDIDALLITLESAMLTAAKSLEFEKAASIRDQLALLKQKRIELDSHSQ